jgi:hypothetical protein
VADWKSRVTKPNERTFWFGKGNSTTLWNSAFSWIWIASVKTADPFFEVVEEPPAKDIGCHHAEQEEKDERDDQADADQRFAHKPLGDRPEPLVHQSEDEPGEEDRHHQREGDHKADQQPGANPATHAALVLAAPREVAQAPEKTAFLDRVVVFHVGRL